MEDLQKLFSYTSPFYPGVGNVHIPMQIMPIMSTIVDLSLNGVFVFAGAPFSSWNSMTQHSIALSTMEHSNME